MRAPFVSATGSLTARQLLLVSLAGRDGVVGYGEAAPLHDYDGVSIDDCRAALEDCRAVLADADDADRAEVLAMCEQVAVLPQAVSAIDLALWDLAGRRLDRPAWQLLGGPAGPPPAVAVNATIAAADRSGAAAEAVAAREAGFGCVKVKVGIGDDAGRVAAVRAAAGREMAIRLDANGAWSVDEALAALRALEPAGIELCEEPVRGLDALSELAAGTDIPVALDESLRLPGALDRRHADSVCLKVSACGGLSGVVESATRARAAGYKIYLASTLDGPLGIAAALHAAAVLEPDRPCGLATLGLFESRPDPLSPARGHMTATTAPGLGIAPDWYR